MSYFSPDLFGDLGCHRPLGKNSSYPLGQRVHKHIVQTENG